MGDALASKEAAAGASRGEWIGLAVLTLACLLYAMDLTVLHLAVPSLSADLRPSSEQIELELTEVIESPDATHLRFRPLSRHGGSGGGSVRA